MSEPEPQPATSPPRRPWFQFSLRTLLLLFVVLGSSLAVFGAWGIAVFGLAVGLAMYVRHVRRLTSLTYPLLAFFCLVGLWLLWRNFEATPSVSYGPPRCYTELHDIAQALQDYHQANGSFPPAYVVDKNGKPLFSWRVLILPFLDQEALYKQYHFDEPWDGPRNRKWHSIAMPIFQCPSDRTVSPTTTSFVAVVGAGTAWPGPTSTKLSDFTDGLSQTIMVVEIANSGIHWMEPKDLDVAKMPLAIDAKSGKSTSSKHAGGANVAYADGHIEYLRDGLSPEVLRALLTIHGGERLESSPDGGWQLADPAQRRSK